ncbi:GntR family transcriptional regulator [Sphingobium sp. LB126]|uniref:aminotransferase-like domain-containing protein n=1 Tax=Sphingobium sp. LB126 TaxID=1983755 RepID=UPI000C208071|nr:PLP-dependent aminotransferase family protein [Sphingobium sp. LB126]PJG47099.1 GntR family transcriptional regulator [Sphingobium sp. LB126]
MWRPRLNEASPMKYLGIVEALEADIRSGKVARGDRVPPQRAIAEALEVDLTTVTRAFNEARRRGLIQAQAGRGTFISESMEGADSPDVLQPVLDLSMNIPPQPSAMDFRRIFPQGVTSVLGSPRGLMTLHYQESNGIEPDRKAAASWLGQRIDSVTAERIIVTGGAQCALFAICELLLTQGDVVAAGAMTYPGLKAVAAQKGLVLEPLAMDEYGIIPDAFDKACRDKKPKALYVVPTIDNPTTATLPEERRRALVALAREYGVVIFEDDSYAPLRPVRLPAMVELADDITWHIATLSKCVTPALRIAYVIAPNAGKARRLAAVLRATILMAPPLMSALASRWIVEGSLDEVTAAIAEENMVRQKLAAGILDGCRFSADVHGHHLWLYLPEHWRATDFADHADRAGVSIVPASTFAITAHPVEAVRISIGVAPDRGVLEDGLTQLAGLISEPALGTKAVV